MDRKTKEEIYRLVEQIARLAYKEGRQHQYEEDFPDVRPGWSKTFEDTETYDQIQIERNK